MTRRKLILTKLLATKRKCLSLPGTCLNKIIYFNISWLITMPIFIFLSTIGRYICSCFHAHDSLSCYFVFNDHLKCKTKINKNWKYVFKIGREKKKLVYHIITVFKRKLTKPIRNKRLNGLGTSGETKTHYSVQCWRKTWQKKRHLGRPRGRRENVVKTKCRRTIGACSNRKTYQIDIGGGLDEWGS